MKFTKKNTKKSTVKVKKEVTWEKFKDQQNSLSTNKNFSRRINNK